jgi:glycine dehydrogenase subunit 1
MPYIPHTEKEIQTMLKELNVNDINALFDEIPQDLMVDEIKGVPEAVSEMEITRFMNERASENPAMLCFIGAGAYDHHIPAPVWNLAPRGEFMTAYTPYQAEASQGTLQVLYEYQTMMASLTGMDVSNASLYDGGSGLAEAVLMAVRANRKSKSKKILMPKSVHPYYRMATQTIVKHQNIELIELPLDEKKGCIDLTALAQYEQEDIAALIIPQPNFFGVLEDVDALTDWAHQRNTLAIAIVNPLSLAILKEPGKWGETGADIVCGDGQPFGSPLSCGGPHFGFLTSKKEFVRQIPGRIIGRTTDDKGNPGFVLTLQAREQHIRRSKATSNICTNQGLMVTAATIYMSLLGNEGLKKVAAACHENTRKLIEKVKTIDGVEVLFNQPYFHEVALKLTKPASEVIAKMADCCSIQAGFDLSQDYPEFGNALLVCCTETKTDKDIEQYVSCLQKVLG